MTTEEIILPEILGAGASLSAASADTFSLISYNVLLPNSGDDGWWVYKYYQRSTEMASRRWAHRQRLLSDYLVGSGADLVCLQETSGGTFEGDFAFMADAGYAHALHRKFRFRNATFWRRDRWALVEVRHKDKTLLTVLESVADPGRTLYLINCHLTAGAAPERRFRQLFEALDQARKELVRARAAFEHAAVVVAGDFNCYPGDTAVDRLLRDGVVEPDFREAGLPERAITSKRRGHVFGSLTDIYEEAFVTRRGLERPATLVVPRLYERMIDEGGRVRPAFVEALLAMFTDFAGEGAEVMDGAAVERWLTQINGRADRGSELRKAREIFEAKGAQTLTPSEFVTIYVEELRAGKPWAVHHDLSVCGQALSVEDESRVLYAGCLDRICYTGATLEAVAVRRALTEAQREALFEQGDALPNAWHPSDHLPQAAVLRWR